jgi:ribonuclease P protein component
MQAQTARTNPSKKIITPLKGVESFSALMRTKPLAAWGQCMVHVLAQNDAARHISLGLIVPKKAYALAVDRNRIRRVLRAQCLELAKDVPCSVQLLFRIKAGAKKGAPSILPAINRNPHSAEFAAAIKHGLSKAVLSATRMEQQA